MPWDSAALMVAPVEPAGSIAPARRIAGGDSGAAFQPEWEGSGCLLFVAEEGEHGRLLRWDGETIEPLLGGDGLDLMQPMWNFGSRTFAVDGAGRILAVAADNGRPSLHLIDCGTTTAATVHTVALHGAPAIAQPVAVGGDFAAYMAEHDRGPSIVLLRAGQPPQRLSRAPAPALDAADVSIGKVITFSSEDGATVYGIHYPPTNSACHAPAGKLPPALVLVHGGPTSSAGRGFSPRIQFYTSRGFTVIDVDYAGSSGYGRAYRQRLDGAWGIADVAGCVAAARHLGAAGLADPARIAIAGGSAGGYTVLMALATTDVFAAGSSHYGISDLALLLAHTHKFEAGYLHRLLGTRGNGWEGVFRARSPLALIERMRTPTVLFQGLDDKVVPPEQSRLIADGLRRRGVPVELHEFAGEAHGFRRAETVTAVLAAELDFFLRTLGISQGA
jgi:dipeptidyl aminopeptidase/acylaminoacyl peptidase